MSTPRLSKRLAQPARRAVLAPTARRRHRLLAAGLALPALAVAIALLPAVEWKHYGPALAGTTVSAQGRDPSDPSSAACPDNRLVNPGLEEGFTRRDRAEAFLPSGWEPWFERLPGIDGLNYPPSYRPVRSPDLVGAGLWSLEQATVESTHTGGIWQRVDVGDDVWIQARAWSTAWTGQGARRAVSEPPGTYATAIGVDPFGGSDPNAAQVEWSQPITITDAWIEHRIERPVEGPAITVFTRGQPLRILPNNTSRWDALCVRVLGPADATPDPALSAGLGAAGSAAPVPTVDATAAAAGLLATATARAAAAAEPTPFRPAAGVVIGAAATVAAVSTRMAAGRGQGDGQVQGEAPEGDEPPAIGTGDAIAEHLGFLALAGALFFAGLIVGLRGGYGDDASAGRAPDQPGAST